MCFVNYRLARSDPLLKKIGAKLQFQQRFGGARWAGGHSSHNSVFSLYYYYSDAEIIPELLARGRCTAQGKEKVRGVGRSKAGAKIAFFSICPALTEGVCGTEWGRNRSSSLFPRICPRIAQNTPAKPRSDAEPQRGRGAAALNSCLGHEAVQTAASLALQPARGRSNGAVLRQYLSK